VAGRGKDTNVEDSAAYQDGGIPFQLRDCDEFAKLAFSRLELVPPGVVLVSE
jgi:hypothetical protein